MTNTRIVTISIIITVFFSLLLTWFSELDIAFSEIFFNKNEGFIYKNNFFVYKIYLILPQLTKFFVISCLSYLVYITIKYKNFKKVICSGALFLILTSAIGPGFVVNYVLKENFGRARPHQTEYFGGEKKFTTAFRITDQCSHNCSFASGHAAMGYFFTAIAYVMNLAYFNRIYISGLIFGTIVGISRIMMGGHFLSDVMTAAFVVLTLNHLIFIIWQKILKNLK